LPKHLQSRRHIMVKRFVSGLSDCCLGIGLLALIVAAVPSPARAQSAADLALCDRVAADPTDPDKPKDVKGVDEVAAADVATAIKFCKVAAVKFRRALYQLGRAYAANQQWPEAAGAFRHAADKGSTSAMVEFGVMLATGTAGPKDEAQARQLFERAATAGNPRGAINLMALGGASFDPARIRALLARAVETNSAEAQYQLGLMMADGTGGPLDDAGARTLFEKAAAQGHSGARTDGRIRGSRTRRTERYERRQGVLREGRGTRQRRRQGRAEARAMSDRAQGQARQPGGQPLLLASGCSPG
jgi:TPR repeat protein